MNSFKLNLSGQHFICPSVRKDSFAGQNNLGWSSLHFITWDTSSQPFLASNVSVEKSADNLLGIPL